MTNPRALSVLLAALVCAPVADAAETSVRTQSGGDLYSAGASVQVSEPVEGDAVLAGGTVLVAGTVAQDVLAAGGSVTLTRAVADDARAAGGSITVTERVGGDAILAGGTVTLAPGSEVAGNAWLAGGVVRLSGTVLGEVRAAAGEVVISGRVEGDARVTAESLALRPGAVITGTLHYRGPQPPEIADTVEVGELVFTEQRFEGRGVSMIGGLLAALLVFISLAVCTLIFAWLLPNVARRAADHAGSRLWLSLGVGLLTAIVVPVLATALMVLVVTTPVAVALFAAYVVLWVAGSLVAVAALAAWLRRRFDALGRDGAGVYVLSVLAAALIFWVVALLPFAGALLVLLAFATGVGGLISIGARLYKQPLTDQP